VNTITPRELKKVLESKVPLTLLDVREEAEYEIANIGGKLIPLSRLSASLHELDKDIPIVVICHHGIRSANAQSYLISLEFSNVINLEGGIDRWSLDVEPALPRY
jgi:rhodanese-related sulfurtransferase